MKRLSFVWIGVVMVAWLVLGLPALVQAQAGQGAITVLTNEAKPVFAKEVRFSLTARSDSPINEITLFYQLANSAVVGRAYPKFEPGKEVEAEWVWELVPGALAPGTEVTYHWAIRNAAGEELRTDKQSFIYEDDRFAWKEVGEGLVRVFTYKGNQGPYLLELALDDIESLEREIGVKLEQPIRIYVYASKSDMQKAIPSRSERYDEMTTTLGMVVSEDTLLLLGGAPDLDRTLAHELSHIVVGLATKNPLGGLPRWLDEGLAMYAEGELPASSQRVLERAIRRDELISVRSLSGYTGDPELVDLFYAEAHSVVSFLLREYGRDKMLALLQKFKQGAYQEDALKEVYGFGLDELDARWRQSLGLAPRQVQTPLATRGAAQPEASREICAAGLLPLAAAVMAIALFRPRGSPL